MEILGQSLACWFYPCVREGFMKKSSCSFGFCPNEGGRGEGPAQREAQPYSHLELHPLSTQWSLASSMSLSCPGTGEPTTRPTRPSSSLRRAACILAASAQFFWTLAMTLPIYRSRLLYHILVGGTGGGVSEDKIQSIHALSPWMVRGLRWHLDVKNTLVAVC